MLPKGGLLLFKIKIKIKSLVTGSLIHGLKMPEKQTIFFSRPNVTRIFLPDANVAIILFVRENERIPGGPFL